MRLVHFFVKYELYDLFHLFKKMYIRINQKSTTMGKFATKTGKDGQHYLTF